MSAWSGAGIPTITKLSGTQVLYTDIQSIILSGTHTIVYRLPNYVAEHQVVGKEGGITERIGGEVGRIEIHGLTYEGGADKFLADVSGLFDVPQFIGIPSFISGNYFIGSGTPFLLESATYQYDSARNYPFYHWVIKGIPWVSGIIGSGGWFIGQSGGTISGKTILIVYSGMQGVDYSQNLGQLAVLFVDYTQNFGQNVTLFAGYSQNLGQLATIFADYTPNLGSPATLYVGYTQNLGQLAVLFSDYTQNLGQLATLHADYTQNLGQQATLFANYVQMS